MSEIQRKLVREELYLRENEFFHAPMDDEMRFYDSVKRGDAKTVWKLYKQLGGEGFGILSKNSLQNLKYHLVIAIAFMTRFCIEGGLQSEEAYSMSDIYIRQADLCTSEEQIQSLHRDAIAEYTGKMEYLARARVFYSRPVLQCMEYVYANLNRNFLISEMAEKLGFSVPYLSRLFHKETELTISAYIMKKRIEEAAKMLLYTEYEAADIANFLAFSSHSHFIQAFKREYGVTPRQYREAGKNRLLLHQRGEEYEKTLE